jgi:hypothetical protein
MDGVWWFGIPASTMTKVHLLGHFEFKIGRHTGQGASLSVPALLQAMLTCAFDRPGQK